MDSDDLEALMARIGSAAEPSRALDAEIARSVGWEQTLTWDREWWAPEQAEETRKRKRVIRLRGDPQPLPRFSQSLGAALSLVPKGYYWALNKNEAAGGFNACCCPTIIAMRWYYGTTPQLALCTAALGARLQLLELNAVAQFVEFTRTRMAGSGEA